MDINSGRPELTTVLGKVMAVLHAFSMEDAHLTLAELSRRTGVAKGTLHRTLAEMVKARLLDRSEHGYRLGGHLFELGMRASKERKMIEVAIPFMEDLYVRTQEVVHLGVLEGTEVVYLLKIGGHRQARSPSKTGGRMPVHCTAIGKVLLAHADGAVQRRVLSSPLEVRTDRTMVQPGTLRAHLDRIQTDGVAYEYEESAVGIVCLAAPVRVGGDVVAALSITGDVHRFRPDAHVAAIRAAATELGLTLSRIQRLRSSTGAS